MNNKRWSELTKTEKQERKQELKIAWFKKHSNHFRKNSKQGQLANLIKQQEKCLKYNNRAFC